MMLQDNLENKLGQLFENTRPMHILTTCAAIRSLHFQSPHGAAILQKRPSVPYSLSRAPTCGSVATSIISPDRCFLVQNSDWNFVNLA